jgi:hypothetical protein
LTDISEVQTASIITLMMEVVHTSETSVHFNMTIRRYIPEDSKLQGAETSVFSNKTTSPHGAISQMALIFILAAVRT